MSKIMIDGEMRSRCDFCKMLVSSKKEPSILRLAGTSKDGEYHFHGETCKQKFLSLHFQIPLPIEYPYNQVPNSNYGTNTGGSDA